MPQIEKVWAFNMDLSKIAEYHPRVFKVDTALWKSVPWSWCFLPMPYQRWKAHLC